MNNIEEFEWQIINEYNHPNFEGWVTSYAVALRDPQATRVLTGLTWDQAVQLVATHNFSLSQVLDVVGK